MKIRKFLIVVFVMTTFVSICQKHEISFVNRIGLSTTQFQKPVFNDQEIKNFAKPNGVYDIGSGIRYKYDIWEKANIFLSAGVYIARSQYTFYIYDLFNTGIPIEQVLINKNRFEIEILGLSKQIRLYNGNIILELGFNTSIRYHIKNHDQYVQETYLSANGGGFSIKPRKYRYNINVFYDKYYYNPNYSEKRNMFLFGTYHLNSKFRIRNNLYLDLGFFYQRNYMFFYDYLYYFELTGGEEHIEGMESQLGPDNKLAVKNDFLNFTFGLSYKFGG